MYSLNRAQILGNLTRDPEMRYTPNGQAVTSFAIATNRRWKDKDGNNQEQTEFHDVVAWGKLAEIMTQILHKGNKVYVEGRLQTRQWEAQDGAKRTRTEVIVEDFVALSAKGEFTPTTGSAVVSDEAPIEDEAPVKPIIKKEEPIAKTNDDDEINLDEIPF
jgi:single-strand DNA-binding protein